MSALLGHYRPFTSNMSPENRFLLVVVDGTLEFLKQVCVINLCNPFPCGNVKLLFWNRIDALKPRTSNIGILGP